MTNEEKTEKDLPVQPNNLTGKDVADEGLKVGKSVLRTALVRYDF